MDSLENVIFRKLIANKFIAVVWYTIWFRVELLLYQKFLNNGLILQALGWKLSSKIIFKLLVLTKSFNQNVSDLMLKILLPLVIWKALHVLSVIWTFSSILKELQSCCLRETSQSFKYCLPKEIFKPLTICIITQSKCH